MAYTTINKSGDYFNTKLYTGNGTTDTAITGVGFQPDFNWTKQRSSNEWHTITDSVRGVTKQLFTNTNQAEQTNSEFIKSLDSDGFTVGTANATNQNTQTFASWNWKANGAGSSNTDGSITSTVSANQTAGFSIVSYTGTGSNATVGHGLNSPVKFIILKRRDATNDWEIGSDALGWDKHLYFNVGEANSSSDRWQNTAPTSSVFSIGTAAGNNASSSPFIAYCFAEKTGYSKFGSYTGNGSTDGTFVYTGFKPAFTIIKLTSAYGESWILQDNKRSTYNPSDVFLSPSSPNGDSVTTNAHLDFLSNGFKLRHLDNRGNGSGMSYIYMAFAAAPLVGTNNVPANAR